MSVAVVTGAAKGIGRATAERLTSTGWIVVGVDLDGDALEATCAALGERMVGVVGDVSDWATHERAADAAEAAGGLTAWVNNAAIDIQGGAHEVTAQHIDDGIRVLQLGPMYGTAVAVRRLAARGGGAIVNVGSIQGTHAFPGYYVYQAAKAAIAMITRGVAVDYGPHGIRCNAVLPGIIETPMTYSTLRTDVPRAEALRREAMLAPMARVGQAHEVADAIEYLLSERSSYVNGAELVVDGGATARCFAYPPISI